MRQKRLAIFALDARDGKIVFRISGEAAFRNWYTGEPIVNSAGFEGLYYSVAGPDIETPEGMISCRSAWFTTWLENGERGFKAAKDPREKRRPCS